MPWFYPPELLTALAPPAGNPPLTAEAVKMDANRNGLVERTEATGTIADRFDMFDYNRDGTVSGAEVARGSVSDIYPATITYRGVIPVTMRVEDVANGLLEARRDFALHPAGDVAVDRVAHDDAF